MKRSPEAYGNFRTSCRGGPRFRETITFARPVDANQWRVGDAVCCLGEERFVTWVGVAAVELAPATWWRRAWYWVRALCVCPR